MSGLPWSLRRSLYEQAASQLQNGREITQVLADFRARLERRGRKRAAEAAHQIFRKVRDGKPLVVALGSGITPLERSVLESGEEAGQLSESMLLVLDVRERTARVRRYLLGSFATPTVYLVALYATLFTIGIYIVPQFAMTAPIRTWTGWAYVMYVMSQMAIGWLAPLTFGTLFLVIAAAVCAMPRWIGPGRTFFDKHIFPFTATREVNGLAWLMAFAALLRAGVPDTDAIATQIRSASPWLASRLRPIHMYLKNGQDLATAMRATGQDFPSVDLIDDVGAYAGFPDFSEKIEIVARQYSEKLERRIKFQGLLLSMVFIVGMLFAILAVQLGANSISSILTSSMGSY